MNPEDLERELAAATAGIHPPASAWSQIAQRGRVRRTRRVAVAASAAVAVLLAGGIAVASNQWLAADTPSLAATAAPTTTPTAEPTPAAQPSPTHPELLPSASPVVVAMAHDYWFESPSGNIECYLSIEYGSVECQAHEHQWRPPAPKPGECDFGDWGVSMEIAEGRSRFTCQTDTVFVNPPVVLEYGTTLRSAAIDCTSTTEGMRCSHRHTGHGFFVSRARYEFF